MDVWFWTEQEPPPRGTKASRRARKSLYTRSSEARQKRFCLLDTGLSWMSFRACLPQAGRVRNLLSTFAPLQASKTVTIPGPNSLL